MRTFSLPCALLVLWPLLLPAQTLVINEIAWMGTRASASDEWIELFNCSADSVTLAGCLLTGSGGSPNILLSGTIPPRGYFLLERTDDQTVSDQEAGQIYTGDLNNNGEWLQLTSGSGHLLDEVRCDSSGWFAGTTSPRRTMERRHPLLPGSLPSSWDTNDTLTCNGRDAKGGVILGTPGAANSRFDRTLQADSLSRRKMQPFMPQLHGYPNPFQRGITITWQAGSGDGRLEIVDLLGRVLRTWPLPSAGLAPWQRLYWDGHDALGRHAASGTYLLRLCTDRGIIVTRTITRCR